MSRPRLLDLFSGAGGCAVGYDRAGFEVIGVDIVAQPRYPFEHHVADALSILRGMIGWPSFNGEMWRPNYFAAIHASPPCQDHTNLANVTGGNGSGWMLAATRDLLKQISARDGTPWVIENVPGSPMTPHMMLCGSSFGLDVERHRWFELGGLPLLWSPPCAHHWQKPRFRSLNKANQNPARVVGVHGHVQYSGEAELRMAAMGIDWMTQEELTQAIPPAFTEHIGAQLFAQLAVSA